MTRPLYESPADQKREATVLRVLESTSKKRGVKLPIAYKLDFAMEHNGEITSWIEVKCRSNKRYQYPTLSISLNKLMAGVALEERTDKPFFLVVHWEDFLGYIRIKTLKDFKISMGGRSDRGDDQDKEPMVHIPVESFVELKVARE